MRDGDSDWIPPDLPVETKLQLRHEMTKPPSQKDRVGYIYCHEMARTASDSSSPTTLIKLGRSVRPVARVNQWKSQCPSRQPIVRDLFPLSPAHPHYRHHRPPPNPASSSSPLTTPYASGGSRLHGALAVADLGAPFNFRWERLVLIETAGRAALEAIARGDQPGKRRLLRCGDCGKRHSELFEVDKGAYERWVFNLVLRWERWVREIV
jgi:hypothetical protein